MKINYLIIICLIFFACGEQETKPDGSKGEETLEVELIQSDSCGFIYKYDHPSTLQIDLIKRMTSNYKCDQWEMINQNGGRSSNSGQRDARAIWFDFTTLKTFLYQIEDEAKTNNHALNNLGIRIYYTSYPSHNNIYINNNDCSRNQLSNKWDSYQDLNDVDKSFENKHTLVMIPTIRKDDIDIDFDPRKKFKQNRKFNIENDNHQPTEERTVMALSLGNTIAQNHGSLFPPDDEQLQGMFFIDQNE